LFGVICLASALSTSQAQAAPKKTFLPPEIESITNFVQDVLRPFQAAHGVQDVVTNLLQKAGVIGSGPDLATKMQQVQDKIIGVINDWEINHVQDQAKAAFSKYHDLMVNPGQPAGNWERVKYLTGASDSNDAMDVFIELERLILDDRDPERGYQMAVAFNQLHSMMADAMALYPRYAPAGEQAYSWESYDDRFGRALRANYHLIGAKSAMCHTGHYPGYNALRANQTKTFRNTVLYKKRENKNFVVGTYGCIPRRDDDAAPSGRFNLSFNPVRNSMPGASCGIGGDAFNYEVNGRFYAEGDLSWINDGLARANSLAEAEFYKDTGVKHMSAVMKSLLRASGGDEQGAPGDINAHELFDPWVPEPACGDNNPWAWPVLP